MSRVPAGWILALTSVVIAGVTLATGFVAHEEPTVVVGEHVEAESGGFNWEVAALVLTALATLALASVTYLLARSARAETQAVRDEIEAGQRPLVVPLWGGEDLSHQEHVRLKNAGQGPALNVRGALYWTGTAGGGSSIHPQVLAAGAEVEALVLGEGIVVNWHNAVGYLRYYDLSGTDWQTHFAFRADSYGNVSVHVLAIGKTAELGGDPQYNAGGWVNRPSSVELWT